MGVLLAAMLLAVGAVGGFLLARPPVPGTMVSSTQPKTVSVPVSSFDDERDVTLRVTSSASQTITSPVSGTITSLSCTPGSAINSGTAPISIDLMPKIALATTVPPFRTLTPNTRGDDVAALNTELRRLGYQAPQGNAVTWDTIAAYNALAHTVNAPELTAAAGWTIDPAAIVWLPAASATSSQCLARVGQTVTPGQELFSTKPVVTAAAIQPDANAAAGDRIMTIAGVQFPVANGAKQITDAKALAAIPASAEFAEASATGAQHSQANGAAASGTQTAAPASDATTVTVTYPWRLTKPVSTMSVPPSALYDVTDTTACVTVAGKPRGVTIVASQLGRSMVSTRDGSTFRSVDVPPRSSASCAANASASR
ncbi:hypothetical protein [Bifidobacterium leontopitheci]|uniref:hypothetical protein n=1 Tax=Bifidobacterium leontopitheci TaxID=2650774 RepID=UPI001265229F|nr:hypothetical protein [Bifidobacterium leontopitheci]